MRKSYVVFLFVCAGLLFLGIYIDLRYAGINYTKSASVIATIATKTESDGRILRQYPHYPDPKLTPGAILNVTEEQVCESGYAKRARNSDDKVTSAVRRKIFQVYGLDSKQPRNAYQIDHFISVKLGGSNGLENLWPQPSEPRPGFNEKDDVENYLIRQVCSYGISLKKAQELIKDWREVYFTIQKEQQKSPR